jgi:hypothetical protein
MTPEEFATLPEAKASVVITLERLYIHSNIVGEPVTLTTVEGGVFKIPAQLQESAKRIVNSGVEVRGKRGRLTKLLADIESLPPPCDATPVNIPAYREALVAAVVESISSRLEENGAVQALVDKIVEHISNTVTLDQMAEIISREYREEVLSKLGDAMIARFRK